jgi:hypothetical protein
LYLPQLGADLVTIFNDNSDDCGVAYMPVADYLAFSAVMRGCFTGYVLAHELGHNQVSGQHDALAAFLMAPLVCSNDIYKEPTAVAKCLPLLVV